MTLTTGKSNESGYGYASPQSTVSDPVLSSNLQPEERVETEVEEASRKKVSRYRDATPEVVSRRRAQNRASQRAYRERKENRILDLESKVRTLQTHREALYNRGMALTNDYLVLREENARLRFGLAAAEAVLRQDPAAAAAVCQELGLVQGLDVQGMHLGAQGLQEQTGICADGNGYDQQLEEIQQLHQQLHQSPSQAQLHQLPSQIQPQQLHQLPSQLQLQKLPSQVQLQQPQQLPSQVQLQQPQQQLHQPPDQGQMQSRQKLQHQQLPSQSKIQPQQKLQPRPLPSNGKVQPQQKLLQPRPLPSQVQPQQKLQPRPLPSQMQMQPQQLQPQPLPLRDHQSQQQLTPLSPYEPCQLALDADHHSPPAI
ncbi:hypothetical protein GQ602_005486 [Ophiocordyceps camponoti-floridani]|uniref:BZIP domain-containing protein n=1 Tax=Ophiocordyceps camponoti-floridani TaxID=2030778 RepID=A0A8H4VC49_9HYPO|nr:hypothetical protein GQ602_005486 [Ophiocordyceps camponoti-floridani]